MNIDLDTLNVHEDGGGGGTKIKIKALNTLVVGAAGNAPTHMPSNTPSNMSDVTIGDILEHGDFVSSDESGVMHLKISNVMSVDESITGCTVSEDDKDVFANIQIASVTSLLDDEPLGTQSDHTKKPEEVPASSSATSAPDSDQASSTAATSVSSLPLFNVVSLPKSSAAGVQSSPPITTMCIVPKSAAVSLVSQGQVASTKTYHYILRSSLVVPRLCRQCSKRLVCEYRVLSSNEPNGAVESSHYLCGNKCKGAWLAQLPPSSVLDKPRKYFERVCGMCGHDVSDANKGRFSWETREFCNKLCLADHIGYVGQHCRQCKSTVRLLHMGKYCVRFGSDIYQFCSNTCLEKYKQNTQVCCYCQKNLAAVDSHEKSAVINVANNKKYCSMKCHKRALRKDINQQFYNDKKACTVCTGVMVPRFEFLKNNETSYLCSQPCLNVYKFANNYKAVNCCLCLRLLCVDSVTHFLYHNNGQLRVFCSTSCTNVFILSTRRIVTCCFCKVKKYNFDMIQMHDDSAASFYCSVWCLNLHHQKTSEDDLPVEVNTNDDQSDQLALSASSQNSCVPPAGSSVSVAATQTPVQSDLVPPAVTDLSSFATSALPATKPPLATVPVSQLTQCNMCQNVSPAQFHMVMSDNTLRNFCSYPCASRYKVTYGFLVSNKNNAMSALTPTSSPTPTTAAPLPKTSEISQSQPPKPAAPLLSQQQKPILQNQPVVQKPLTSKSSSKAPGTGGGNKMSPPQSSLRSFRGVKTTPKSTNTFENASLEPFLERILERMAPKEMANKSTMCRPVTHDPVSALSPSRDNSKSTSTSTEDKDKVKHIFLPVPIPVFVPAPVAMYSLPVPVPIPVPVPVPIPIIIPTSAENTEAVWNTMKELWKKYGADLAGNELSKSPCSVDKAEQESCGSEEPKGADKGSDAPHSSPTSNTDDAQNLAKESGSTDALEGKIESVAGVCDDTSASTQEVDAATSADEGKGPGAEDASSAAEAADSSASDKMSLVAVLCSLERSLPAYPITAAGGGVRGLKRRLDDQGEPLKDQGEPLKDQGEPLKDQGEPLKDQGEPLKDQEEPLDNLVEAVQQQPSKRLCVKPPALDVKEEECVALWRRWVCKRNETHHESLPQNPCELSASGLKTALPLFLAALLDSYDSASPRPLRGDTLFCVFLGLQKYFFEQGKQYCIFLDSAFEAFYDQLDTAIKDFSMSFLLSGADVGDTRVCEEMLWHCGLLGAHTPWALLNTLFYFNTKIFKLKTLEDHAALSFSKVQKEWATADGQRSTVLKFSTTHSVDVDGKRVKKDVCYEMTENKDDPLRCPVKLYEFYLSKCPKCVRGSNPLYVEPRRDCLPDSAFWYSEVLLTSTQLRLMLNRVLLVSECLSLAGISLLVYRSHEEGLLTEDALKTQKLNVPLAEGCVLVVVVIAALLGIIGIVKKTATLLIVNSIILQLLLMAEMTLCGYLAGEQNGTNVFVSKLAEVLSVTQLKEPFTVDFDPESKSSTSLIIIIALQIAIQELSIILTLLIACKIKYYLGDIQDFRSSSYRKVKKGKIEEHFSL
ncbi:Protein of unknown function DUF3504 [Trinorchestia longiramus]|nr:Protein of unknown function DUF3504 [Trinorchestia longiramus]